MLKLTQEGKRFVFFEGPAIYQYSSNIPIEIVYDPAYDDYIKTWCYGTWGDKAKPIEHDISSSIIYLPYDALKVAKTIYIQCDCTKGDEIIQLAPIKIKIRESLDSDYIVTPSEPSDIQLITDIVKQHFEITVIPVIKENTSEAVLAKTAAQEAAQEAKDTSDNLKIYTDKKITEINDISNTKKEELTQHSDDLSNGIKDVAKEATVEFNKNAEEKNIQLSDLSNDLTNAYNDNANEKIDEFNEKHSQYLNDAEKKADALSQLSSSLTASFNDNVKSKTDIFNANVSDKLNAYNDNDTQKTNTFDKNAENKISGFNDIANKANEMIDGKVNIATQQATIATEKADALSSACEKVTKNELDIAKLDVKADSKLDHPNMPLNGRTRIDDAESGMLQHLEIQGEVSQFTTTGTQLLDISTAELGFFYIDSKVTYDKFFFMFKSIRLPIDYEYCVLSNWIETETAPHAAFLDANGVAQNEVVRFTKTIYPGTFILNNPNKHPYLRIRSNFQYTDTKLSDLLKKYNNIMLNKGDIALPYEPYTGGLASPNIDYPQDITSTDNIDFEICGENLFDYRAILTQEKNGITFTNNGDGSFNIKGTPTALAPSSGFYTTLDPGEYCISACNGITKHYLYVLFKNPEDEKINYISENTFTLTKRTRVNVYLQVYGDDTDVDVTCYPMLNKGSKALSFKSYQGTNASVVLPEYLYNNKICEIDDVLGIKKEHGLIDFDGNENWVLNTHPDNNVDFRLQIDNINKSGFSPICTHFINKSGDNDYPSFCQIDNFLVFKTNFSGVDEWKSFLSNQKEKGTPVRVLYQSKNSEFLPLSLDTQKELRGVHTQQGVNNVLCDAKVDFYYKWYINGWYDNYLDTKKELSKTQNELDYTKDMLDTKMQQPYVSTGVKTYLDDADSGKIRDLTLQGKSTQFSTTGAQLFDCRKLSKITVDNGVTYINKGDGSFLVNGEAVEKVSHNGYCKLELPAGNYFISGSNHDVLVWVYYKDIDNVTQRVKDSVFTLDKQTEVTVYMQVLKSTPLTDVLIYPMLNKGDIALPFEPYTGGLASPNINYPQDITSTDNIDFKICGDNLFDYRAISTQEKNGITFTNNDDGSFIVNGATSDVPAGTDHLQINLSAGNYFIGGSENDVSIYAQFYENGIKRYVTNGTFTLDESKTIDVYLQVNANKTINNMIIKPMLNKGDTASLFEPYKSQRIEMPLDKPLYNNKIIKQNGVFGIYRNMECLTLNGDKSEPWRWVLGYGDDVINGRSIYQCVINTDITQYKNGTVNSFESLCNRFIFNENVVPQKDTTNGFCVTYTKPYLYITIVLSADVIPQKDVTACKNWLAKNPIDVLVPCNAYFEPLPDDIQQQLQNMSTYYGCNNILSNVDVDFLYKLNLPSFCDIQKGIIDNQNDIIYDLQTQLNKQEIMQLESALINDYRMSLLELGIGGDLI